MQGEGKGETAWISLSPVSYTHLMPEDQSARGKELCYVQPLRIAEENDGAYHVVPDV